MDTSPIITTLVAENVEPVRILRPLGIGDVTLQLHHVPVASVVLTTTRVVLCRPEAPFVVVLQDSREETGLQALYLVHGDQKLTDHTDEGVSGEIRIGMRSLYDPESQRTATPVRNSNESRNKRGGNTNRYNRRRPLQGLEHRNPGP